MVFRALADLFVVHEIPATPIGICERHRSFPVVTLVGANSDAASADAVPPDSTLEASSRGCAVAYEADRPTAETGKGEHPAPKRRGALGGPRRGCARSLPLSPSERSERLAMDSPW